MRKQSLRMTRLVAETHSQLLAEPTSRSLVSMSSDPHITTQNIFAWPVSNVGNAYIQFLNIMCV